MKGNFEQKFPRRDLFRFAIAGTSVALIGSQLAEPGFAESVDLESKRRARYNPNSEEVRDFYRVNSYPAR